MRRSRDTVPGRILAIAAEEVRRHGARRSTVVSIAAAAGMTHANVYRYFASKQALFDALTEEWLRGVERQLADIAAGPAPADDKVEHLVSTYAGASRDRLEQEPALFAIYAEAVAKARPLARSHRRRMAAIFEGVIEEGLGSGTLKVANRLRALRLIFDAVYRFTDPNAMLADKSMARAQFQQRLDAVVKAALRSLIVGRI